MPTPTDPFNVIERTQPTLATAPCIVAYGMGVDSTAMLIGMAACGWRPEAILFADTGDEKAGTYAYRPIIAEWLAAAGFPALTIVKNASPIAGDASLSAECMRKRMFPSLAYGGHSCSLKWKVAPQEKWCRDRYGWDHRRLAWRGEREGGWKHGPWITKLVGYDAGCGDGRRINHAQDKWPPGFWNFYPLAAWGWDREECKRRIIAAGLPVPPKSACWMCPAAKRHELDYLAETQPELVAKGLEMERLAAEKNREDGRTKISTVGLGRSWRWSDHTAQQRLF